MVLGTHIISPSSLLHFICLLKPHISFQPFYSTESKQNNLSMAFSWFRSFLNGTATVLFRCVLRCFRFVLFRGPPLKQIKPSKASSSSSSSHPTPPSSSQSWNYGVFLSFRGTDTRKTFVDHLYSALVQQGIDTYKDDQTLPRGEAIGPSLLKAIEESRIAVIVFSENYADSSWCLDELAYIMKCKDARGQIVMPIFYHMDPSEVRKQKGKYGEALSKHESENKNVESWRKALTDVGNISGWEPKHIANGHEAKCIKEIVDTISNRLNVGVSSDMNKDLIGIEDRLQDLKSKLQMESSGALMVGIWGVGGGGKTTLASSLYNEISSNFDGYCFVENIREESSKIGLPKLQNEILSMVLKQTQMEVNRVVHGRDLIKSRFRHKKVLIVLDDVDHLDQLKALAGSHDWFGEGSRIIITTRDNHLLNAHKVHVIYNISLLNDDESMKLFRKHAQPIEDYETLSKDVVSYAGGLPLALIVLGSFLCDKNKSEWRSALARLKDVPDTDIVEKLKISYDGLKPMEKELFLDIACFFMGQFKDSAMEILDACGFHPIIGIKVLIQKALITVSQEGKFGMHDLLQEMGHYIVRGENPRNLEKHNRMWQIEDVVNICAMHASTENDRIIELEALQIRQHWHKVSDERLPPVVENMKKLRWISCIRYPATSFSSKFQPMNLCYLGLKASLLEQLWGGYKLLPSLKALDLSRSRKLVRTPDFKGLPCLERLTLKYCTSLTEIHPSIGYHESLVFVDMRYCQSFEIFPPIIRMRKLEILLLSFCDQLHKFPEIQMCMDNLVELHLRKSGIEIVPSSIGKYCTNLRSLDLRDCDRLQGMEGNFHRLKYLKGLYLNGCDQLKIPAEGLFGVECCLQVLSLCYLSLKKIHGGVVSLKLLGFSRSLTRLNLSSCKLVDGDMSCVLFEELSNLQALDLSHNSFSRLHSSLTQLPALKFLNLSCCKSLVELPVLPSSIAILLAFGCDSLEIVGNFSTNLKWLWKVSLPAGTMLSCIGQFMLQGNAIEDYFTSIQFDGGYIPIRGCKLGAFTLQLPRNWYTEFCGFLIYANWHRSTRDSIVITDLMGMENEDDVLDGSDGTPKIDEYMVGMCDQDMGGMCYISFGSLRHTSWWNSTHTTILFSMKGSHLADIYSKVELVPRRSKGESIERATNLSEFWDEEAQDVKTFKIKHDSKSCIEIRWGHDIESDLFHDI